MISAAIYEKHDKEPYFSVHHCIFITGHKINFFFLQYYIFYSQWITIYIFALKY